MALQSGLPDDVDERLARFAWHSNQFKGGIAKDGLFKPYKGETSVFRRSPAQPEGLRESAMRYEQLSGNSVRAAAFIAARVPVSVGLTVNADEPPSRHAAIRGWRTNGDEARAHNDALAKQIAVEAEVIAFIAGG